MNERQGEAKKRRRNAYEHDDDEYKVEMTATSRRKNVRRAKDKKPFDSVSPNGSAPTPALPLHPIPMYNNADYIEEEDMRECSELLTKLMKIPSADPFLEPVDYITLELPHYPTFVKIPMDLGTVKKMLQHGTLENPGHFADHVRLVFKNAMEFNQPGSGIYNDAESLLATFEDEFNKLCDKWATEPSHPEVKEEDKKEVDNEEKDKKEIDTIQQNLNLLKANTAGLKKQIEILKKSKKKPTKIKRVRLSNPKAPLTYKEKEELCKLITDLSGDDLPGLLEIIQSANPSSGGSDDGEFEIDIERIDDMTLLDVKKYVEKCTQTPIKPTRRVANRGGGGGQPRNRQQQRPNSTVATPPAEQVVLDTVRLAIAQSQTSQRIHDIQRQIQDIKSQQI